MPWPTDDIVTTSLDSNADKPNRSHFLTLFNRVKEMIASRATVNGVAPLDADSKVPAANLPRGDAGGVAPLDASSKVPVANLPIASQRPLASTNQAGGGVIPLDGRITSIRLIKDGGTPGQHVDASVTEDGQLVLTFDFSA